MPLHTGVNSISHFTSFVFVLSYEPSFISLFGVFMQIWVPSIAPTTWGILQLFWSLIFSIAIATLVLQAF